MYFLWMDGWAYITFRLLWRVEETDRAGARLAERGGDLVELLM